MIAVGPRQIDKRCRTRRCCTTCLFRTSAETLLEVAADPAHLGACIGFLSVLHTWGQNLMHHPHVHCVIPAGGVSSDQSRWVHPRPGFFLPVRVLSKVFRGKFHAALKNLFRRQKLQFHGSLVSLAQPKMFAKFLRQLFRQDWVVYAKRSVRRTGARAALPRALHAPGRYLQPPVAGL